jgi:ABC-type branched-subunit amino acid transport system substrate-binding protein
VPGAGAGQGGAPAAAATCTGASGPGVAGGTLSVGVLSDLTGPIPGLFASTVKAVNAWAGSVNSRGGVCGLTIQVKAIDSKTNQGDNRAGALQACNDVFALVGSMSAFDQGGAPEIDNCGIPDLSAMPTSVERGAAANTYAAFPNVGKYYVMGPPTYVKQQFPDAITKAAIIWTDAAVPAFNAQKRIEAESTIGYDFIYTRAVSSTEANYTPYVIDMRSKGVQYVSMISEYTNIGRLVQAFRQQNYNPAVFDFDSAVYDGRWVATYGDAVEGALAFINTVPLEEAGSNPELQLYTQWLGQTGGGNPDYFGIYAWSAGRLFEQAASSVKGELTREALLAAVQGIHSWDGHGMHAAHDVGAKTPSPCFMYVQASGGAFVRKYPQSGFDCDLAGLYEVHGQ